MCRVPDVSRLKVVPSDSGWHCQTIGLVPLPVVDRADGGRRTLRGGTTTAIGTKPNETGMAPRPGHSFFHRTGGLRKKNSALLRPLMA
jgi:hypothetical protein